VIRIVIIVARDQQLPSARIVSSLIDQIRSGELRPGDQVPTLDAICKTYSVSRVTALRALGILRESGWITTVPRWGSFVADTPGIEPPI
jgi:DNA-binding GntR family transcriptional regulator